MSWDGKMYNKYRIAHTDGTPLKGKKYFVLRLDSDDPVEAARVAAAMRAYKREPRNCDKYATHNDAMKAFEVFVCEQGKLGFINPFTEAFKWLFAPATEKEGGNDGNE